MADINTLLGMGVSPQDNMQALADKLRNEQQTGQMLGMSTLSPVAQYGQNMASGAADSAKRGGVLRQAMEKEQTRQRELKGEKQRLQDNIQNTALAKTQAAKKVANVAAGKRDTKSFWHPTNQGEVLNLREAPDGKHYDQEGNAYNPQALTPYKAPTATGSRQKLSKTEARQNAQKEKLVGGRDFVSKRLTSPHMAGSMGGVINVGSKLPDILGINPKVGSLQEDLSNMTVQQAAEPLSYLGVNPTDKDLSFALEATRNLGSQPESWRDWYRDIYTAEIEKAINSDTQMSDADKVMAVDNWREMSRDTVADMNKNISLESGKGWGQRLSETWNEENTEEYKAEHGGTTTNDGWSIKEKQ